MNLKEKLQELAQERQNLQVAMIEVTGAMKILEQQKIHIFLSNTINLLLYMDGLKKLKLFI